MKLNFDATTVTPAGTYEVLPAGEYPVTIARVEIKPTKKGDGQYLEVEMDIQSDEHRGRKLFDRLNLWNPNPQTVEIAQRQLSAICHASGRLQVEDSDELVGATMIARVIVKTDPEYGDRNEIRAYKALQGFAQQAAARPAAPAPRATASAARAPASAPAKPAAGRVAPWAAAA